MFKLGDQMYAAKLVDLPAIIESQKHFDGKQMFKTADISQVRERLFLRSCGVSMSF